MDQMVKDNKNMLQDAFKLHQDGDLAAAETFYNKILEEQPGHIDANFLLGTLNLQQENLDLASTFLKRAIKLKPDHVAAYNNLGTVLQAQDKLAEAVANFNKVIELQPDYAEAHYNLGNALRKDRKLDEAVESYRQSITLNPNDAEVYYNLGNVLKEQEKLDEAVENYRQTVKLKPDDAMTYCNLGALLQEQGILDEATANYNRAIEINPNYAEAHYNLGTALQEQDKLDEAVSSYNKAIAIKHDYADTYNNLGTVLQKQDKLDEAVSSYNKAIAIKHDYADAYNNLGTVLQKQDKLDEAVTSYNRAIEDKPDYAEAHYNLGTVLQEQDKLDEAVSSYNKAIALKPDCADAYNNLSTVLQEQGKLDDAVASYNRAIEVDQNYAEAYYNLGAVLQDQDKLNEALSCYQKTLQLKPDYTDAHINIGNVFKSQGKFNEAFSSYRNALRLKPDPGVEVKASLLLPVINESKESIKQHRNKMLEQIDSLRNKELTLEDPYKQIGSANYYLAYHGLNDKEIQERIASFYINACPDLVWTSPNYNKQQQTHGKIKIGIISNFLFDHTIGKLNSGIIKNLSRERFHVKLFRFLGGKEDHLSKAMNDAADEVVILPKKLRPARQEIADHSLDILFYLDIGMDPFTYFLAFSRLAPVQCVTWGHPVTTGIPNMDYFISSDKSEPPGADSHYSERLILPDRLTTYYYRPELPENPPSREKFGIPENFNLYACPQTLFKFHPDFDDVLGAILRQDPSGVLVLIEGKHKHWKKLLLDRFSRAFPDVIDRVRFLPLMPTKDFLSLFMVADVVLDTPFFGGGNTSLESFACGVPVVTWPGEFMRDRLTLALYKQMGIMDCVADNAQSYLDIAFRLANDKTWKSEIKDKIRANADVLYEDIEAVRELERFFEMAVEEVHSKYLVTY